MISFLKKFLGQNEEVVNFSELDVWLDRHNSELSVIKEYLGELERLKLEVSENLKVLENVDVSSAKVEDRVKNIVQGNLPAYTNTLSIFLRKMLIPKDTNLISLEDFCDTFEKEFDSLNKRTFRNFQIIRELVGKELEEVAKSMKSLDLTVKDLKKSLKLVKEITGLKEKVGLISNNLESKEKNEQKRQELQKNREELLESYKRANKEIENLKVSKKAKDLEEKEAEEKKISDKIRDLENQLTSLFSPLQKALKKYNNICFVKKVDSYVENPVNTLLEDTDLEVLKFLKDVKKMIEDGKIDLKDDKRKKTVENLDLLNESFFKKFLTEHSLLKKELTSVQREIKLNNILKEISELEKESHAYEFKIENVEREINKIRDFDINLEVTDLEKRISEVFGLKVKVGNVVG